MSRTSTNKKKTSPGTDVSFEANGEGETQWGTISIENNNMKKGTPHLKQKTKYKGVKMYWKDKS